MLSYQVTVGFQWKYNSKSINTRCYSSCIEKMLTTCLLPFDFESHEIIKLKCFQNVTHSNIRYALNKMISKPEFVFDQKSTFQNSILISHNWWIRCAFYLTHCYWNILYSLQNQKSFSSSTCNSHLYVSLWVCNW